MRNALKAACAAVFVLTSTLPLSASPTARSFSKLVFDRATSRPILFGGTTRRDSSGQQFLLNDTWTWTGRRWVRLYPADSPSKRTQFAMVYDSNRSQTVLFGGVSRDASKKFVENADTWVFRGGNWTQLATPSSPSARRLSAAAFDPLRDRVVLFGGTEGDSSIFPPVPVTTYFDTWEFDGTTWTRISENGPKLPNAVVVYDGARNEVLLLGLGEDTNTTEMYRWVSPSWVRINPATIPPCPGQASAVYQDHNQRIIFASGACASGQIEDANYEWDGTNWTKLDSLSTHLGVISAAITYDEIRQETLLFGGVLDVEISDTQHYRDGQWRIYDERLDPGGRSVLVFEGDPQRGVSWLYGGHNERDTYSDLWQLQNNRWTPVSAPDKPVCSFPTGAFDTERGRLVIFCETGEVSEWDGEKWHTFTGLTDKPGARRFASVTYDARLKKTILFGGFEVNGNYSRETWLWSGTSWEEADPDDHPDARMLGTLFYDPTQQKTYIFGGIGRPRSESRIVRYDDMWSFDGTTWTEVTPTTKPGSRYGALARFNPQSGKVVMFGGKSDQEIYLDEQWEWNGATWAMVSPPNRPSARMNQGLAVDPSTGLLTLFGGYAEATFFSELWTLRGESWQVQTEPFRGRSRSLSQPGGTRKGTGAGYDHAAGE